MQLIRVPGVAGIRRRYLIAVAIAILLLASAALIKQATSRAVAPPVPSRPVSSIAGTPSYARDVAPILEAACVRCHGEQQADKGLRLDSYQRALAGDSYGAVLIPGKSSLSALVSVVKYGTMPHDGVRMSSEDIDTISRWIDAGAPEN